MIHTLKTDTQYFQASWVGDKPFEIRQNDRDFKERDEIVLKEWTDDSDFGGYHYTGREIHGFIRYLTDFKQQPGYVVFSYQETHRVDE